MQIQNGGQLESLKREGHKKLTSIRVSNESTRTINLMINDESLSYLTIEEALDLRDELNSAITSAVNRIKE